MKPKTVHAWLRVMQKIRRGGLKPQCQILEGQKAAIEDHFSPLVISGKLRKPLDYRILPGNSRVMKCQMYSDQPSRTPGPVMM